MARYFPVTTEVVPANVPGVWMIRATFKRSPARLLAQVFNSPLAALDEARRLTREGIVFSRKPTDPAKLQAVINSAAPKPQQAPRPRSLGIRAEKIDRTLPKPDLTQPRGPMSGAKPTDKPVTVTGAKLKREANLAPHLVEVKNSYNQRIAYALQLTRRRADHLTIVRNRFVSAVRVHCDDVRKVSWNSVPTALLNELLDHFVTLGALKKSERRAILADHNAMLRTVKAKRTRYNTTTVKQLTPRSANPNVTPIHKAPTVTAENARPPANIGKGVITAEFRRANGIW